ncbi:histone deacetylase [Candidatus Neomarinimicrobiota bacterium]
MTKPMRPFSIYWSEDFSGHADIAGHPESPTRLSAIVDGLKASGRWTDYPIVEAELISLEALSVVHSGEYIKFIEEACNRGVTLVDGADTLVTKGSWVAAMKAAGAGVQAVDEAFSEQLSSAFILCRPPGHHALSDRAMGFCLFNNVAVAAQYALDRYGLDRVAIIDWDVHHGNGTQDIFYGSERVKYISLHEHPLFPGTGAKDEIGIGPGSGFTHNFPLAPGQSDREYINVFETAIADIVLSYKPELLLISAGFDAHHRDPLGHMTVTSEGFGELTKICTKLADEICSGRVISMLEGGYDLTGLSESVVQHVDALADAPR